MPVRRALLLVGVATLVVVDVLLVALAVGSVQQGGPAPVSTEPPPLPPRLPDGGSLDTASLNTGPGSQRPVHLDAGVDGTLLRATRGACEDGPAAQVELSDDGGETFRPVESPATEVLRIDIDVASDMWLVGLDESCSAGFYRSSDEGRTWQWSPGTAGTWHTLPIAARALHAPGGRVPIDCTAQSLTAVDYSVAYVVCADDTLRVTRDGGETWLPAGRIVGLVAASFRSPTEGTAVASTSECPVRVWTTTDGGAQWTSDACLEDADPVEAVTRAGDTVYIQQGGDVLTDAGDLGLQLQD
jgi:photosystem II stability/assembly factor-like uncharacterized protein